MAQKIADRIEIVDQPEDLYADEKHTPWYVFPLVIALAALSVFFLIRRMSIRDEH